MRLFGWYFEAVLVTPKAQPLLVLSLFQREAMVRTAASG